MLYRSIAAIFAALILTVTITLPLSMMKVPHSAFLGFALAVIYAVFVVRSASTGRHAWGRLMLLVGICFASLPLASMQSAYSSSRGLTGAGAAGAAIGSAAAVLSIGLMSLFAALIAFSIAYALSRRA